MGHSKASSAKPVGHGPLVDEILPMRFPIVIHSDSQVAYGVTVPDLPGCFSAGSTMDEALQSAVEAIECHIEGLLLDGEDFPTAGSIEQHARDPELAGGTWALVEVDLSKLSGQVRRVNVTIPERVLERIDAYANRHGTSRSGALTAAAFQLLASQSPDEEPTEVFVNSA